MYFTPPPLHPTSDPQHLLLAHLPDLLLFTFDTSQPFRAAKVTRLNLLPGNAARAWQCKLARQVVRGVVWGVWGNFRGSGSGRRKRRSKGCEGGECVSKGGREQEPTISRSRRQATRDKSRSRRLLAHRGDRTPKCYQQPLPPSASLPRPHLGAPEISPSRWATTLQVETIFSSFFFSLSPNPLYVTHPLFLSFLCGQTCIVWHLEQQKRPHGSCIGGASGAISREVNRKLQELFNLLEDADQRHVGKNLPRIRECLKCRQALQMFSLKYRWALIMHKYYCRLREISFHQLTFCTRPCLRHWCVSGLLSSLLGGGGGRTNSRTLSQNKLFSFVFRANPSLEKM